MKTRTNSGDLVVDARGTAGMILIDGGIIKGATLTAIPKLSMLTTAPSAHYILTHGGIGQSP